MHDDRLRLIFTCCHPALALPTRVALTLRLLGGLSTAEIARAFLVAEPAIECDPESRILRVFGEVPAAHVPVLLPGAGRLDRAVVGSGWAEWFSPSAPA